MGRPQLRETAKRPPRAPAPPSNKSASARTAPAPGPQKRPDRPPALARPSAVPGPCVRVPGLVRGGLGAAQGDRRAGSGRGTSVNRFKRKICPGRCAGGTAPSVPNLCLCASVGPRGRNGCVPARCTCGSGHDAVLGDKVRTAPMSSLRSPKPVPTGKNYIVRPRGSEGWVTRAVRVTAGVGLPPFSVTLDKALWA